MGVQPQTFVVPPPPQLSGAVQVPQSSVPQQPSGMVPQFLPSALQVVGAQHVPNVDAPRCLVGFLQQPLQQLTFV
jgi:hypothetical protein